LQVTVGRHTMQVTGELSELMEDDDWALIFSADGQVKGVYIPRGKQETDVPREVEQVLIAAGINIYTGQDIVLN